MDGLSAAASLIAVLQVTSAVITICYAYRQGQKHSSREVIQLSDELNSLKDVLDALLRLVEKPEDSNATTNSSWNSENRLATFEVVVKPDGPLFTCKSELERLKAKLEPESGWRAVKRSLVWPLKEGELRKALGALERLKGTMQLALAADQATMSLALREDVGDLTQAFQSHSDGILTSCDALIWGSLGLTSTGQRHRDISKWLAAPDPHANHVASRKKRQPNSGEWFLNSKPYENWLHCGGSFLWLYGIRRSPPNRIRFGC
jgi:hypothetical protein